MIYERLSVGRTICFGFSFIVILKERNVVNFIRIVIYNFIFTLNIFFSSNKINSSDKINNSDNIYVYKVTNVNITTMLVAHLKVIFLLQLFYHFNHLLSFTIYLFHKYIYSFFFNVHIFVNAWTGTLISINHILKLNTGILNNQNYRKYMHNGCIYLLADFVGFSYVTYLIMI